jgi:DNA-binding MltR family transcriptional regulator
MKPIDLDIEDYEDLVREFHGETDRAAAIIAGGFLESYLAKYLKSHMISDKKLIDALFDGLGPLSGFSQRVNILRAFSLISKKHAVNLDLIGKIRNHFAHHPKTVSFSDAKIGDWISGISTWELYSAGTGPVQERRRAAYLTCISFTVAAFHNDMLKRKA